MNVLKFSGLLILSIGMFLTSCTKEEIKEEIIGVESNLKMRTFSQADAESLQLEEGTTIEKISNQVSDNWTSTIFKMENGQMVASNLSTDDFEITQVFLKQTMNSGDHTFLYQDGATTSATHAFTGDDVIGIDMNFNGEYVRMSDIDVFDQSDDSEYEYINELGVEVFADEETGTQSAVYHFPIGSTEDDPETSLSGLWMRIVLDFN